MIRSLFAALTITLFSVGACACGGTGRHRSDGPSVTASSSTASASSPDHSSTWAYLNDEDGDLGGARENRGYRDHDDSNILSFGHTASAADRRTVTAVVRRYYRAAAAGDGRTACALLLPSIASVAALNYGRGAGPSYLRGAETCQAVMVRLFKQSHDELSAPVTVTGVLIRGENAYTLLGSTKMRASYITLLHEHGAWKIDELLGGRVL